MTHPTCYASGDGPGLAAWDLAHERMAPEDARRSAELARHLGIGKPRVRPTCLTEGCEKHAETKGLCATCYQRRWKAAARRETEAVREEERQRALRALAKSASGAARAMVGTEQKSCHFRRED